MNRVPGALHQAALNNRNQVRRGARRHPKEIIIYPRVEPWAGLPLGKDCL